MGAAQPPKKHTPRAPKDAAAQGCTCPFHHFTLTAYVRPGAVLPTIVHATNCPPPSRTTHVFTCVPPLRRFGQLQAVDVSAVPPAVHARDEGDVLLRADEPQVYPNRCALRVCGCA
jgi:hypothetical protein